MHELGRRAEVVDYVESYVFNRQVFRGLSSVRSAG
jgi:hypothetical protein